MAAAISGSTFVVLPHTGHLPPRESPGHTNAAIEAFLAAH
jgi:pimeloyl-ACP methyl ester carboxylesterase